MTRRFGPKTLTNLNAAIDRHVAEGHNGRARAES
jgi:hypothetical protein